MNKTFHVTDLWGAVGVMLLLVFVYLILTHWTASQGILSTTFQGSNNLFQTLQGR